MSAESALRLLFRFVGAVLLLALVAVFLPTDTMARIHAALGLGEMPRGALVEYLTRSLSALYALHGGVFLLMASDLRRYREMAIYFGAGDIVFGCLVFGIGLRAGLPPLWLFSEGPPTVLMGLLFLWLALRVPTSPAQPPGR
jgi:hypothetical protein